jgi:hypothetical protein
MQIVAGLDVSYLNISKPYWAVFQKASRAMILGLKKEMSCGQSF